MQNNVIMRVRCRVLTSLMTVDADNLAQGNRDGIVPVDAGRGKHALVKRVVVVF